MKTKLHFPEQASHEDRPHAILSMSQAERFMTCPGSVLLSTNKTTKETSSPAALEGTLAHTISEIMLRNLTRKKQQPYPNIPEDYDPHMLAHCLEYVSFICNLEGTTYIETPLQFKNLHKNLGGTSDAINISRDKKFMQVVDLKFGKSPVSATENYQLMGYAVGARKTFNVDPDKIMLSIFQPRSKQQHSHHLISKEHLDEFEKALQAAAVLTDDAFAPLKMTEKGCYWCKAKPFCPEYLKKAQAAAATEFAGVAPKSKVTTIAPANLLSALDLAQQLLPWCEAVIQQAKDSLAADPAALPGFALKPGRTLYKWKADAVETLPGKIGVIINQMGQRARETISDTIFTHPTLVAPQHISSFLEDAEFFAPGKDQKLVTALKELINDSYTVTRAAASLVMAKA